ncbi:MAG: chemotaxis protein CheW [Bacillota bacterium]
MINILKLRQLEKEKKVMENSTKPQQEEVGVISTEIFPTETAETEIVEFPEDKGESQADASENIQKLNDIKEEQVREEIDIEVKEKEVIDPAEQFRQNLIQQILQDETMITRAELQNEAEQEQKRLEEQKKIEDQNRIEEQKKADEKKKLEEERKFEEEKKRLDEERRLEEVRRLEEERRSSVSLKSENTLLRTPSVSQQSAMQVQAERNRSQGESRAAEQQKSKKALDSIIQLVGFEIGREYYGIEISRIKEINRMTEITKVPRAPQFIEGVINLRGTVIPVINLRTKVRMPKKEYDKDTRIIIVELSGKTIGFIVDKVREVLRIPDHLLDPPPALTVGSRAEYITAVAKMENDLVILMDPEKLLTNEEIGKLK